MAPKNKINLKDKLENGELDLSMSDLQEVPVKEIAQEKKATSLDLSNNRLTTLGKNFVTLTHIIKLDLSKNLLKELPEDFGEMKQLKHLDLYSNQITHLPLSFCELKNLRWLDLKNNPLVPAVAKIVGPCLVAQQCQQSAKATVAFLTEMKQQVEEEKERIRILELKEIEVQQEKEKQQKKRNERKKAAKAKKKETSKKEPEKVEQISNTLPKQELKNGKLKTKDDITIKKDGHKKSSFSLFFRFILALLSVTLLLFLLSASNALGPKTDFYRTQVTDTWNNVLQTLPPSVQNWGNYTGIHIEKLHTLTGIQIDNICNFIMEINENEHTKQVKYILMETWHYMFNQSSIILKNLSEKIYIATDELKKKLF